MNTKMCIATVTSENTSYFPFGFEGKMWDLIVSVPDHCLSCYFGVHEWNKIRSYTEKMQVSSISSEVMMLLLLFSLFI